LISVFKACNRICKKNGKGCRSSIVLPFPHIPLVRLSLGELLRSRARFCFTERAKIILSFGKGNIFCTTDERRAHSCLGTKHHPRRSAMSTSKRPLNFAGTNFYIGIDVHLKQWTVTIRARMN